MCHLWWLECPKNHLSNSAAADYGNPGPHGLHMSALLIFALLPGTPVCMCHHILKPNYQKYIQTHIHTYHTYNVGSRIHALSLPSQMMPLYGAGMQMHDGQRWYGPWLSRHHSYFLCVTIRCLYMALGCKCMIASCFKLSSGMAHSGFEV